MPLIPLMFAAALAAPPAAGAGAGAGAEAAPGPAAVRVELWLSASGAETDASPANPEAAMARAALLSREGSHAAASRAYQDLVRRWPGAPQAEAALLAAAGGALSAGEFDRAVELVAEARARWPSGAAAAGRDLLEVRIGEGRLAAARAPGTPAREAARHVAAARKIFAAVSRRERAGPAAERARVGAARALHALGSPRRAAAALEAFLKEFPRSELAAEAGRELAAIRSERFRGLSPERQVLAEAGTQAGYSREILMVRGEGQGEAREALEETYRAIAARQAELKIEEARLYVRLRRRGAAEWVLRSVLRHHGDTPSAARAAEMLAELSDE